jgi:hypothetical protein
MKLRLVAGGAWVLLALLGACAKDNANDNVGGEKLNSATPLAAPAADSPAGDANADDPQTGLNTQRPDSPKDLKPSPP